MTEAAPLCEEVPVRSADDPGLDPREILVVRRGPGANCSSIGSALDILFLSAVAGGAILAAVAAAAPRSAPPPPPAVPRPPPAPRSPDEPPDARST